jgi:hypothetical protein
MVKFFIRMAAIMVMAGLVLTGCGDGAGNGEGFNDPKTLVITGLLSSDNGKTVSAALWDEESDEFNAVGEAVVSGGTATIALYSVTSEWALTSDAWTGSGTYYVVFWDKPWNPSPGTPVSITRTKVPFTSGTTSIRFADIISIDEWQEQNGNQEQGRGEEIGKISGTVSLTNIPAGASVAIYAYSDDSPYWSTSASTLDLSGVSGTNVPWTIPLHENDLSSGAAWDNVTGTQTVGFWLIVDLPGSEDDFEVRLEGKQLNMTTKTDIQAGSLGTGTVSLASVKLSGTISVNDGGSPVPRVQISAQTQPAQGSGNSIGWANLESPAAGASWSMTIPAQQGEKVVFRVSGYDASYNNQLFSKTFEPAATASVSTQPISGIALNIGDISQGRIRGTVSFTNVPSPAPYRIYLSARYQGAGNSWQSIGGGGSPTVTVSGNAGSWTIPQDEEFLAYLGNASLPVTFSLYMQIKEGENSFIIAEVEKTLSKAALTSSVDLGTVSLAYVTLSGTISVNNRDSPVPRVYISAVAQNTSLGQVNLNSPAANTPWLMYISAQGGGRVTFSVYGYDAGSNGNQVFYKTLEPAATASVSTQSIGNIALDIGDVSILSAPTGLSAEIAGYSSNTVVLNWDRVAEATSYRVYRSTSAGGTYEFLDTSSGTYSHIDAGLSAGTYYYKVSSVNASGESPQSEAVSITVSGNNDNDDDDETLSPDIDSSLLGTWKDKAAYGENGTLLTATFTSSTVTWGGSLGDALNTSLAIYQSYGSFTWVVKNGNIDLVYIDPTLGRQSYTCYTYVINGSGELELKVGGVTFATLVKS